MAEDFNRNGSEKYISKTDHFLKEMNESFAKQVEEHSKTDRFSAGIKDTESVGTFQSSLQQKNEEEIHLKTASGLNNLHKNTNILQKEEKPSKKQLKSEKTLTVGDYLDKNALALKKKKKIPLAGKILIGFTVILLFIGGSIAYYVNYAMEQATIVDADEQVVPIPVSEETFDRDEKQEDAVEIDPEEVLWGKLSKLARKEEDVVNILLVGEEDLGEEEYGRGRTDCMIIATISKKENALKLTSLMRDMYVQIPGFSDNKLNEAYRNGGMPLLEKTIELNFGVTVDGYILVDFDSFEDVIDALGGVEIKLSKIEANYLNKKNYISKKKYRNVKPGKQILNGNQARGYTRIRYVRTANGLTDDWGRNYRQRKVLNAIFQKYKSKSVIELVGMLPEIFSLVTTDLTKKDMLGYIGTVLTINADKLETMSIPVSGSFTMPYINGMSVLLPDLGKNQVELHNFLFGDDEEKTSPKKKKNN